MAQSSRSGRSSRLPAAADIAQATSQPSSSSQQPPSGSPGGNPSSSTAQQQQQQQQQQQKELLSRETSDAESSTLAPPPPPNVKLTLMTSDGEEFVVEGADAVQSQFLKGMIDEDFMDGPVPLPNLTALVLARVLEFFRHHRGLDHLQNPPEEVRRFQEEFVRVERDALLDLLLAANYLEAKTLMDVTCEAVADEIKDMTVEDVRAYFNIQNDYTREEEDNLRKEYSWAFD